MVAKSLTIVPVPTVSRFMLIILDSLLPNVGFTLPLDDNFLWCPFGLDKFSTCTLVGILCSNCPASNDALRFCFVLDSFPFDLNGSTSET